MTNYLEALRRLMVIEDQPAWAPHLRSTAVARKAAKRHFVDPSLAVAALRADLSFFGLLFESLVVRNLRIYASAVEGQVQHYRDSTGLEVDAIVSCPGQRWAAFEIKLGTTPAILDAAAAGRKKFASTVDFRALPSRVHATPGADPRTRTASRLWCAGQVRADSPRTRCRLCFRSGP